MVRCNTRLVDDFSFSFSPFIWIEQIYICYYLGLLKQVFTVIIQFFVTLCEEKKKYKKSVLHRWIARKPYPDISKY